MSRRRGSFEQTTSYSHLLTCDRPLSLDAKWIWLGSETDAFDSIVVAAGRFRLGGYHGPVRVWASCTGDYELWVDGQWIGRGPTPSSLGHVFVDEHTVEGLSPRRTYRVVMLGRNDGFGTNSRPRRVGGLIAQVETPDGAVLAATDTTWRVGRPRAYSPQAPRLYSPIGFAEYVDMSAYPDALGDRPEASTKLGRAAVVEALDAEALLPREIPALTRQWCPAAGVVYRERIHVPRGITSVAFRRRVAGGGDWRGVARTALYVTSAELPVTIEFRCDDAARVKAGGRVVLEQGASAGYRWWMAPESLRPGPMHGGEGAEARSGHVTLRRGWNPIEVHVDGCDRSWGFMMRLVEASGRAMDLPLSALRDVRHPGWALEVRPRARTTCVRKSHEADTPHHQGTALSDWQVGYDWQPGGPVQLPLVLEPDQGAVIDLGCEQVGFTEVEVDGPAGAVLDLRYSEAFNDLGRLEAGGMTCYGDRLRLRDGRQRWRSLGRKGWRYVQVSVRHATRPVAIRRIGVVQTSAVAQPEGSFACSDPLLNQIHQTSVHTLRLCMQEHWLDCPTREWGQYPGDARVEALQAYYAFADTRLSRKGLRQFARIQGPDGYFRALAPAGTRHRLPDYCLVWVTWLAEHFRHTGDHVLVQELYPAARAALGWFEHLLDRHGLLVNPDDYDWWLFLDHSPIDKRGEVTGFNAFYVHACRSLAELAHALGRRDETRHWQGRARAVATAMRRRLWSAKHRLFADCRTRRGPSACITQATNVLAVWSGATGRALGRSVMTRLIAPDGTSPLPIELAESGFFKNYVLGALYGVGLGDRAMTLVRRYWGAMLEAGCTTWRECFSVDGPIAKSSSTYCHAWSGAPGYFLPAYVLGVRPASPGYDAIAVAPHLGDLAWAEGAIPTPHGMVSIRWERRRGVWRGRVRLPKALPCRLTVPRSVRAKLEVHM